MSCNVCSKGNENDFLRQLNQAIEEACQAADTVKVPVKVNFMYSSAVK